MQRIVSVLLLASVVAFGTAAPIVDAQTNQSTRHIVAFKYKTGTTEAQIKQVTDAFRELKNKIPGIVSFEHGVNNSTVGKNQGFTHVYVVTLRDVEARDAYIPHPEHKKFGEFLARLAIVEASFVVDYVAAP